MFIEINKMNGDNLLYQHGYVIKSTLSFFITIVIQCQYLFNLDKIKNIKSKF